LDLNNQSIKGITCSKHDEKIYVDVDLMNNENLSGVYFLKLKVSANDVSGEARFYLQINNTENPQVTISCSTGKDKISIINKYGQFSTSSFILDFNTLSYATGIVN